MDVWRICRSQYAAYAFAGYGAERTGGRWNFKGQGMVYSSQNLSLAILELFVHVSPDTIPVDLISICGKLPNSISQEEIKESDLPSNWREYPVPPELQQIGADWLGRKSSLVLIVPSAINPQEKNILMNPSHPEIIKLIAEKGHPFRFDSRLFRK